MPFALVPFLLLIVPIIEIGAFIAVGGQIGIAWTLAMILATAIVGTILLRIQGFHLLNKIRNEINSGRVPGRALGYGAMILVAGILLLTPGFVTDTIGFLLFIPFVRSIIWSFVAQRISVVPSQQEPFARHSEQPHYDDPQDGPIIDLDEKDYETGPPDPNSPWNQKPDR